MKASKVILSFLMIASIALIFVACKKKTDNSADTTANSKSSASDNALAENLYNNAKDWADQAMAPTKLKSTMTDTVWIGTCVIATLDTVASNWVLTINFGTTNCQCLDSLYRRGKIICTFTGSYWMPGTVITYTFDNYFVNDNQVTGTKVVTNKGVNASQHLWWEITENGSIIKANNGGTVTWISDRQLEWTEGMATLYQWWDDVYQLTGEAHGVNSLGDNYQYTIVTPLKRKLNCQWIASGVITLQVTGLPLITMDYGDGTCNNNATITLNGQTYPITLP